MALKDLSPGAYEFRVRTVDLNGFAQPEPRPDPKSGRNEIQAKTILVMREEARFGSLPDPSRARSAVE